MENFDYETPKATPEWLTSVLRKNGFLTNGQVVSIEQEKTFQQSIRDSFLSLKVEYTPESTSQKTEKSPPSKIIMKMINPEQFSWAQKEVDFYRETLGDISLQGVMTCYGMEKIPEKKQGYVLLEDLTQTHYQTDWPMPPMQNQCEGAITVLSQLHAYWWNHPRFGDQDFEIPKEEFYRGTLNYAKKVFPQFVDLLGDRLSNERRKTFELLFEKLPDLLLSRLKSHNGLTLCHGDVNFWNFLYPTDNIKDRCVLFDWQTWRVGLGANDLAYLITLHCYPEHRQRIELALLKQYCEEMRKQQIDIDWNEIYADYKMYVIYLLLFAIWRFKIVPAVRWWFRLENGFGAFDDLNCMELLQ